MSLTIGQLEIARLWPLVLLLVVPLLIRYWRRTLVHFSPAHQRLSLAIRVLLSVLLVVALCGIKLDGHSSQRCVVLLGDGSQSVFGRQASALEPFVGEAASHAGDTQLVVVDFAAKPRLQAKVANRAQTIENSLGVDLLQTDIAAAIARGRALVPTTHVPAMVLLTDGNQTTGDALAAAKACDVPISVVPLPGQQKKEVYVAAVETKWQVRKGEPFYVDVIVYSTGENQGTVKLQSGSQAIDEKQVPLAAGENRVRFHHAVSDRPVATLTAKLEGFEDHFAENNEAGAVVFTQPKPRVLLIESEPALAGHLAKVLVGEDIEVEVRSPDAAPERLEDLQKYELLILSNVPAASLPAERMELIERYVRDLGGGLIVVGGDRAFTPGGYRNTIIERVLPVVCEPKKDKPKPTLAMVLVLDRSGSMKEGGAIELAKQAARRAVANLGPRDQIGIVAFEDRSRWASEILPCSDKQEVLDRIDTITAAGGTNMYPAIEQAYLALNEAYAELKHMIVLTDGLSHPGDFDELARAIAESGITVSTVAVGEEAAQELLKDIAKRGGGNFYYCDDPAKIPQIFALETISAGKVGITEEPFFPQVVHTADVLADLDFLQVPTLLGFVETRLKPTAQLILSSKDGDPLLAKWRYGRGTSVAFTSDIQSRWAAAWLRWDGFGRFWAQLVRHAMRKDESRDFGLRVERRGDRAKVLLDAITPEGEYVNGAEAVLKVIDIEGKSHQTPMPQVGPGRYAADFAAPRPGTYYLEVALTYRGALMYLQRRGLVVGFADELRVRPTDTKLLGSIAEATGGLYDPKPADVFAPSGRTVRRTTRLWPYLMVAILLIFVADVALKRVELGQSGKAQEGKKGGKRGEGKKEKGKMERRTLSFVVLGMICPAWCWAAEPRAEVRWQVAPPVAVSADRAHLLTRPTLEEIVAGAGKPPAAAEQPASAKTSTAVIQGDLFPLRYRRIIRRYFELIRRR